MTAAFPKLYYRAYPAGVNPSAGNKFIAIAQKIISDSASTMVVMTGLATTAGSRCNVFANRGIKQPTALAITTVANSDSDTTRHNCQV